MRDEELTAAIEEVRARARARTPNGQLGLDGVVAADLDPLLHARDAAEAKVAAIGTVNPRPPGFKNNLAQSLKRWIARALDWHIREQVEFNRAAMACVQATLEALADSNRALAALATHHAQMRTQIEAYQREVQETNDIRRHWAEWRVSFEDRRAESEIRMLRAISELQGSFQHRVTLLEQNFRELTRQQHGEFSAALDKNTLDVQNRLWADLRQIQLDFEKLIHSELRVLRQKQPAAHPAPGPAGTAPVEIPIDWMRFGDVFRGPEERIREQQQCHAARFAGTTGEILDLGCGRGEFLEAARELGLEARGIDQSAENVALCLSKGLAAERADLFAFLAAQPDRSLAGAYCSQVVEHLPPDRLPVLVGMLGAKLRPGALLGIETPNPECLAIFATHFYIDPTHTRPVPPVLLRFYLEEAGFGGIEVERLAPAVESIPALAELPTPVRETLFGGLDYAIFARKL